MGLLPLLLLIATYFSLASSHVVGVLRRLSASRIRGGLLIALLLIPYLLAALPAASGNPTAFLGGLARMTAYLFVPGLVLLFRPARNKPLDLFDLVAILALWLPIEFDWLPDTSAQLLPAVDLPVPLLTAVCLGFLLFLVIRPVGRIGYTYKLTRRDATHALLGLGVFALVGTPLGIAMGFIQVGPAQFDAGEWVSRLVAIYFLNALPEELLFRGAIQNLIEQRFGQNAGTLILSAVVFGLSHLNNVTAHHGPPNWPYVLMATLAGLAYGWTWRRSEKITVSALTHTFVNFIWAVFFVG